MSANFPTTDVHPLVPADGTDAAPGEIASLAPADTADWYPDPLGRHRLRYFDGMRWTTDVTHYGPSPCHGCSDRRR